MNLHPGKGDNLTTDLATEMNWKKSLSVFMIPTLLIAVCGLNVLYWTTTDRQQECIAKLERGEGLSLYEKCSVYSIHLAIMSVGYLVSPEAATEEFYLTYPHGKKVWHNNFFVSKCDTGRISLPYTPPYLRVACALNGYYVVKNDTGYTINGTIEYPFIREDTKILCFRINEGLLYYLQEIGWLFPYDFEYIGKP